MLLLMLPPLLLLLLPPLLLLLLPPLLLLPVLLLLQTASVMQPALQLLNPFAASTHRSISHDDSDTTVVTVVVVTAAPPLVLNWFGTLYSGLAPAAVRLNYNKVSRKCVARSACKCQCCMLLVLCNMHACMCLSFDLARHATM
jgi:hypothetical protein